MGGSSPAGTATHRWTLCGGVEVVASSRADGDLALPGPARARLVDRPWTVLHQVHGARVVTVASPGEQSGEAADGAVTSCPGTALAVLAADCAGVALASPEGVAGVAHAGWRGLLAGVVEATVAAMRTLGASRVEAVLGPCIRAECYAFGAADLDAVAARLGPSVRAVDRFGQPALDLAAAVAVALRRAGAALVDDVGICTGCSGDFWSWRARGETGRQAMLVCPR